MCPLCPKTSTGPLAPVCHKGPKGRTLFHQIVLLRHARAPFHLAISPFALHCTALHYIATLCTGAPMGGSDLQLLARPLCSSACLGGRNWARTNWRRSCVRSAAAANMQIVIPAGRQMGRVGALFIGQTTNRHTIGGPASLGGHEKSGGHARLAHAFCARADLHRRVLSHHTHREHTMLHTEEDKLRSSVYVTTFPLPLRAVPLHWAPRSTKHEERRKAPARSTSRPPQSVCGHTS